MAVLPFGRPGVISASMLGLGRALGETIAVALILPRRRFDHQLQHPRPERQQLARTSPRVRRGRPDRPRRADRLRPGAVRHHAARQHRGPLIIAAARSTRGPHRMTRDSSTSRTGRRVKDRVVQVLVYLALRPRRGPARLACSGLVIKNGLRRFDLDVPHALDAQHRRQRRRAAASTTRSSAPWSRSRSPSLIAVPIGLLTAIYLVEYGRRPAGAGRQLLRGRHDRRPVDRRRPVHPSPFWILVLGFSCSGFAGVAGAVDPDDAGRRPLDRGDAQARPERAARGVLRAGRAEVADDPARSSCPPPSAGIITGVMLAVARVTGETAPLLLTVFVTDVDQQRPVQRAAGVAAAVHLRPDSQRGARRHRRQPRLGRRRSR